MIKQRKFTRPQEFTNIFNDMGPDWEAIVNRRDTSKEATFIRRTLHKKRITLDLCCGTGRHSILLHKQNQQVVGMDLSKNLLQIARDRMEESGVSVPLVRADMRFLPFKNQVFDAIINMFTSFGYLPSKSEDASSLSEVRRTLRKHGQFLLDLLNRDHVVRNFRERDWAAFEPFYLLENRTLDLKNSKLRSEWTLIRKASGQIETRLHEVRLYTFVQMKQLIEEAGLAVEEIWGGYEKQEFNLDSSRMIIIAQK